MPFSIEQNYPGANIKVTQVTKDHVTIEPDTRDSTQWWFYWNFCVSGVGDQTITFESPYDIIGPWGPAISTDGVHWHWQGSGHFISHRQFAYTFSNETKKVFFAFSLPYQLSHFESFYAAHASFPEMSRQILAQTKEGRDIPLLQIGSSEASRDIVLTCRHHACESTASYLLEGLVEDLLSKNYSDLLRHFRFHIIPFMDLDGVEKGDQGKARAPHDHNLDYIDSPIYASTAALMEYVGNLKPIIGMDFHCPGRWGAFDNHPFFVKRGGDSDREVAFFSSILEQKTLETLFKNHLIFNSRYNIDLGQSWNKSPNPRSAAGFFDRIGAPLAITLEFPYFGEYTAVTCENARNFGKDVLKSFRVYLNNLFPLH